DRGTDRLRLHLRPCDRAGAARLRNGPGRHRRNGPDARLAAGARQHGPGRLRHRLRLHAVGDPAVHPDGQLRGPGRAGGRAVPSRLRLHRAPAWRAGPCDRGCVRRLRRDLRLVHRHRGHHEPRGLPVHEKAGLQRFAVHRRHGGRRHAGHHDPAVHHHGDLRHRDANQHRQAVRGRRAAGPALGGGPDADHLAGDAARSAACAGRRAHAMAGALACAARHLGRAAADGDRAGRHLRRLLHRHRGRGVRRGRCLPVRSGAPTPVLGHPLASAGGVRAHYRHAVHAADRRHHLRQLRQLHHAAGRPDGLDHPAGMVAHHGGGGHDGHLRAAGHRDGGTHHGAAHHPVVLPHRDAAGVRPALVRRADRDDRADRADLAAGGHEPVRHQCPAAGRRAGPDLPWLLAVRDGHGAGARPADRVSADQPVAAVPDAV
ncbi:MAG: TRAP dicarboxylate transporter, DctM subunit, unknown substrate 3, partial [uncultured Ramlibacter sp.]